MMQDNQSLDSRLDVVTPESVTFHYTVAGLGSRLFARIIDGIIEVVIVSLAFGGLLFASTIVGGQDTGAGALLLAVFVLFSFVVLVGYFMLFEIVWSGQTPGKRLLGLRVINQNGYPVTFLAVMLRNLVRIVDEYVVGLGPLIMFFNGQARRLGDLVAGTVVIKERGVAPVASGPMQTYYAAVPRDPANVLPGAERLEAYDYDVVCRLLNRMAALPYDQQQRVTMTVVQSLVSKMGYPPPPPNADLLEFLHSTRASYEALHFRG